MRDMKNLSTQSFEIIQKSINLTMPFGTEETNTSDTKDDTDNLIVLGSNRKVRCIGQIWSSKNPIETTGTSKYSIIP